ncbi:MAG: recombinase family protein [Pseudomonadota bacterium]
MDGFRCAKRTKIGYARVSTIDQNLERQLGTLRAAGCYKVFKEKASGASLKGRPQLERAIDALGTDDVLVIAEWDRATRSMDDGLKIITRVADRGAAVLVLDRPYLDLTKPLGKGLLGLLSAMAEDECERILRRANEGRRIAKENGVYLGRKPKLTDHQRHKARERLTAGETATAIALDLGVHKSTISRLLISPLE